LLFEKQGADSGSLTEVKFVYKLCTGL